MNDKKIIIYSLSTCVHCRDTINYIAKKGVEFSFIDIDILEMAERKKILKNLKKINPECTFPTTAIGEKTIIGFEVDHLDEALNS